MKHVNIVLPDSAYQKITKLAQKKGIELGQYCSAWLTELADQEFAQPAETTKQRVTCEERVNEMELIKEILMHLKKNGGSAPKVTVESAVYEKFKDVFKTPYYLELVGGGVPRWRKNVQFARNTARNMGLIKPPEQSGRGNWELTEKGGQWEFE